VAKFGTHHNTVRFNGNVEAARQNYTTKLSELDGRHLHEPEPNNKNNNNGVIPNNSAL
jgi:hypothetical protein